MNVFVIDSVPIARELANHLWQSTLFAAGAGLMALALRKNHAGTRHWLWMAASVKFLAPFAVVVALGSHFAPTVAPRAAGARIPVAAVQIAQPFALPDAAAVPSVPAPAGVNLLPGALFAVWFCGCAAVVVNWLRRWRRVASVIRESESLREGREVEALGRVWRGTEEAKQTRRSAPLAARNGELTLFAGQAGRPAPLWAGPLGLVSSSAALEPGVFGIFRPVLWLPKGIGDWLSDAQLEAILAHELCHARRRDNLAAAIHMVVEALFWFHPLVWWMGARLTEERERACDEEVVRLGGEPRAYAEGVLKVCNFCLASPLPCAAGVTGADLKKRIEAIMTKRFTRKLSFGKKALLGAGAALAVAGPVVVGLMNPLRVRGQQPGLEFEVASIHPASFPSDAFAAGVRAGASRNPCNIGKPSVSGTRVSLTVVGICDIIRIAYDVKSYQVTGVPASLGFSGDDKTAPVPVAAAIATEAKQPTFFYDVEARSPGPAPPSADQVREMLRGLLRDRFRLTLHREKRELSFYALVPAKGGPKLTPAVEGCKSNSNLQVELMKVCGQTTEQIARYMNEYADRSVIDMTGISGKFDYEVPIKIGPHFNEELLAKMQEHLKLRLEPRKGPIEVLVVDHVERPSEN